MEEFLLRKGQIPDDQMHASFNMEQVRRDLDGYRMRSSPMGGQGWATEFQPEQQAQPETAVQAIKKHGFASPGFSSAEFQKFDSMQRNGISHISTPPIQSPYSMSSFQRPMGMGMGYGMGMGTMGASYRPLSPINQTTPQVQQSKGKGRMVELDDTEWEAQFSRLDQPSQTEAQQDEQARQAMETELNQMDRSAPTHATETPLGDFESIWRGIEAESQENRTLHSGQYGQTHSTDQETWNDVDPSTWDAFDSSAFDTFRDPATSPYIFEQENPYITSNTNRDPYAEGMRILQEGGNLSLASLAFEAAVQKQPEHVDAWQALGHAQAQNEKEIPAIRAFTQCLQVEPDNLPSLMGLAISYTNEGYDSTAFRTLERWLSVKYPSLAPPESLTQEGELGGFTDRHLLHEKVTNLFIQAAQLSPAGPNLDPDVQVGLGVLFYGAEEYDKAVDCFNAALASSEQGTTNSGGRGGQQHLLWNRLGATLANSSRSEEAIEAYERALELEPNFVRARYNLGVSCINMSLYEQAAQHLLGALSMHKVVEREGIERVREVVGSSSVNGGNLEGGYDSIEGDGDLARLVEVNQSTNLIETLRRVFQNMGRRDLAGRVEVGMDIESFRGEFDF